MRLGLPVTSRYSQMVVGQLYVDDRARPGRLDQGFQRHRGGVMEKPVCLITGATEGVGKATAQALARKGFTVVLAARSLAKAETTRREIAATSGAKDIDIIIGDLSSLEQVRQMAEALQRRHPRLDLLINNAGIMMPERTLTEDGFESNYQVNYLSHF